MFGQFKALIIHSQQDFNNQIKDYLKSKDYICQQVITYKDLENYFENQTYDCVIIEDNFPRIRIRDFLVQIKLHGQPIVIVLSDALAPDYLESLLNAGADDYLTEPFALKDLDIKIQSVYKNGILKPRRIYRFKDIVMDTTARTCSCHGKALTLTKNVVSYLFEQVWCSSTYEDGTSIPALISNVIMKLRLANNEQEYIKRFGKDSYKMAF